ncbi:MAG: choice-of-anchor tandem repeat GloVer-containing protein [Verrucomicrobiia bacterium]
MKNVLLLSALILFIANTPLKADSYAYTSLHIFTVLSGTAQTNSDGADSVSGLTLSSNVLYGLARLGGISNYGTIFKLNTDGSGFTTLYNFTNGTDGGNPGGGSTLVFSGDALYGVTGFGGTNVPRKGAVFTINTDGTGFTNLYSFHGSDGQNPTGGLTPSGSTLYGTAFGGGGTGKHGTIFEINTDGSGFATLFAFSGTNGSAPVAPMILSGNTLFGTTRSGGPSVAGSIFRVDTDGNNFTNLYSFTNGLDGSLPESALALAGNVLFGTTTAGGISNYGTLFQINTDGSGFSVLHEFTGTYDAGEPFGGPVLISNVLYGNALAGNSSSSNWGTIYKINTDGNDFTNVYNFTGGSDGAGPGGTLVFAGNTLYGTTAYGGIGFSTNGNGTIFALTFPVSLNLAPSAGNLTVSWPSPSTSFTLQTNGNLASGNWANYGTPTDDGTNKSVIISPQAGNLFFRLAHP